MQYLQEQQRITGNVDMMQWNAAKASRGGGGGGGVGSRGGDGGSERRASRGSRRPSTRASTAASGRRVSLASRRGSVSLRPDTANTGSDAGLGFGSIRRRDSVSQPQAGGDGRRRSSILLSRGSVDSDGTGRSVTPGALYGSLSPRVPAVAVARVSRNGRRGSVSSVVSVSSVQRRSTLSVELTPRMVDESPESARRGSPLMSFRELDDTESDPSLLEPFEFEAQSSMLSSAAASVSGSPPRRQSRSGTGSRARQRRASVTMKLPFKVDVDDSSAGSPRDSPRGSVVCEGDSDILLPPLLPPMLTSRSVSRSSIRSSASVQLPRIDGGEDGTTGARAARQSVSRASVTWQDVCEVAQESVASESSAEPSLPTARSDSASVVGSGSVSGSVPPPPRRRSSIGLVASSATSSLSSRDGGTRGRDARRGSVMWSTSADASDSDVAMTQASSLLADVQGLDSDIHPFLVHVGIRVAEVPYGVDGGDRIRAERKRLDALMASGRAEVSEYEVTRCWESAGDLYAALEPGMIKVRSSRCSCLPCCCRRRCWW
jgi:hypothetical protein